MSELAGRSIVLTGVGREGQLGEAIALADGQWPLAQCPAAEAWRWVALHDVRRTAMSPSEVEIDDAVVAINIHQQFPFARNAEDLYNCTRGLWRLDSQRAARARYLFAVYQGIIKEVYEIYQCIPARNETKEYWRKRLLSQGKDISPACKQ